LNNVDDYLGPSQACVNPLFTAPSKSANSTEAVVLGDGSNGTKKTKATVTLSDCLSCSGCVTSAEAVLMSHHSIEKLREPLQPKKLIVFTISAASLADLYRHLYLETEETEGDRDLSIFLNIEFGAKMVIDGILSQQISLLESAEEFCYRYKKQQVKNIIVTNKQSTPLPMLASSCPGFVCLVEKTAPKVVPLLSSVKSPMAVSGALLKNTTSSVNAVSNNSIYHVAIMPCHDKKLEAGRNDFAWERQTLLQYSNSASIINEVDLVLTTGELLEILTKAISTATATTTSEDEKYNDLELDTGIHGSGSYADFIFRFATRKLFGCTLPSDKPLPWKGSTSFSSSLASSEQSATSVLRFATAYGFKNVQLILQNLSKEKQTSNSMDSGYDYVEIMACPSGCPNGGGQIGSLGKRETPRETKERVRRTVSVVPVLRFNEYTKATVYEKDPFNDGCFGRTARRLLHTRFHVVP
ncbi:narf-like protein, partial [Thalassiosira pseudonana CCMP1335]